MLYMITCRDKPDSLELRKSVRDKHIAFLRGSDEVVFAGPMLNDAGDMCGSIIAIDCTTKEDAIAWVNADPYNAVDLFQTVTIDPWLKVLG